MERFRDFSNIEKAAVAGVIAFGAHFSSPYETLASHCTIAQIIEAPQNMAPVGLRYSSAQTGRILKEVVVQNGSRVEIDAHELSSDGKTYNNLRMQSRTDQEIINGFCFEGKTPRRVRLRPSQSLTPTPTPTPTQTSTPTPTPEDRRASEIATAFTGTAQAQIRNLSTALSDTANKLTQAQGSATETSENTQATNTHLRDVIGRERFYKVLLIAGAALAVLYALTRRYNPRPVIIRGRRII